MMLLRTMAPNGGAGCLQWLPMGPMVVLVHGADGCPGSSNVGHLIIAISHQTAATAILSLVQSAVCGLRFNASSWIAIQNC